MEKAFKIGLLIIVFSFFCSLCFALERYTLTDLGHLGGNRTCPYAINNDGKSTGYSYIDSSVRHAFLYDNGNIIDLGAFGGFSSGNDINDFDVVAGTSRNMSGFNRPFIWESGFMTDLGTLYGYDSGEAHGINNTGQVIGLLYVKNDLLSWRAALWENSSIMKLFEITSIASGINDLSQVVGGFKNDAGEWRAFIWENEEVTDLGIPRAVANDINDNSQIAGHLTEHYGGVDHNHPFIWENGTTNDLRLPNENNGQAIAINNRGQVVGFSQDESYNSHAVLWEGGTWYYLDDLIPPTLGLEYLYRAFDINDKGQIVAQGIMNGGIHAFLLTPITTIDAIINFFDDSVADGSLTGYGPGNSANGRLSALRNMLEMAGDLINVNDTEGACTLLKSAAGKCDSLTPPPDFATGESVYNLYSMIVNLMTELGCD